MRIDTNYKIPNKPEAFIEILNELSIYLESNDPTPDHWDEKRRSNFYSLVQRGLTKRTKTMLSKLLECWS